MIDFRFSSDAVRLTSRWLKVLYLLHRQNTSLRLGRIARFVWTRRIGWTRIGKIIVLGLDLNRTISSDPQCGIYNCIRKHVCSSSTEIYVCKLIKTSLYSAANSSVRCVKLRITVPLAPYEKEKRFKRKNHFLRKNYFYYLLNLK